MRPILICVVLAGISFPQFALAEDEPDSGSGVGQEVGRQVMGDDMPDFRSIWGLSSLTDDQRSEIKTLMENFQQEAKPLRDELMSIRDTALQGGSLTPEQMQEAANYIASGNMPQTSPAESKVMARVQELKGELKAKRTELWEKIKNVLTSDQISQVQNF